MSKQLWAVKTTFAGFYAVDLFESLADAGLALGGPDAASVVIRPVSRKAVGEAIAEGLLDGRGLHETLAELMEDDAPGPWPGVPACCRCN